jgi:hypothetical protein
MRRLSPPSVALVCAGVAVAVAFVPIAYAVGIRDWGPSALVRMSAEEPMAGLALRNDPDFKFVHPHAHYDGVYFYAVALDPFARGEAHELIDKSAYRYGHAGYGWMGWVVSFGRAGAVPAALMLLALAGLGVAAGSLSLLLIDHGTSGWGGLAAAFNPGLIYSATALTSEPVGAAVMVTGLLLWLRGRLILGAVAFAALCLIKEPFVLVPAGLVLWELVKAWRTKITSGLFERVALLSIGPALFAAWYVYLRSTFGEWPYQATEGFFWFPVTGWAQSIKDASEMATGDFYTSQIGAASGPLIAAFGGLLVLGLVIAFMTRSPISWVYILLTLVIATLGPLGMLFPKDMIREVSMPLLLLPAVVAAARAAPQEAVQ